MKKQLLLSALLMASLSSTFVSCKKDDNSSTSTPQKTRKDMVVGTWNLKGEGTDLDSNNILIPSEYNNTATDTTISTFNADGTGKDVLSSSGLKVTLPFTWSLADNDQTLQITQLGSTDKYTITVLNDKQFEYYIKDTSPRDYMLLTK